MCIFVRGKHKLSCHDIIPEKRDYFAIIGLGSCPTILTALPCDALDALLVMNETRFSRCLLRGLNIIHPEVTFHCNDCVHAFRKRIFQGIAWLSK